MEECNYHIMYRCKKERCLDLSALYNSLEGTAGGELVVVVGGGGGVAAVSCVVFVAVEVGTAVVVEVVEVDGGADEVVGCEIEDTDDTSADSVESLLCVVDTAIFC
jgi:hypothetical protein